MPRILVVDDEEEFRKVTQELLETQGHAVRSAADGRAALAILAESPIDLLILDIYLPGMDGFEILQRVRGLRPDLPVIAISGGGTQGSWMPLDVAKHMGAHAALAKPLDYEELFSVVRALTAPR